MAEYILTVYCGHDAGAALLRDGELVAAIAQERLDRIKHSNATGKTLGQCDDDEGAFPWAAMEYCLAAGRVTPNEIAYWATNFDGELSTLGRERVPYPGHHLSHAALAFYSSGAERCAVLVMDYAGDSRWLDDASFLGYERETAWLGDTSGLTPVWHHLGTRGPTLFGLGNVYNQVAAYMFGGHSDCEGKLMALAARGRPNRELGESFFVLRDGAVYVRPSRLFVESGDRPSFLAHSLPHYACDLDWDALPPSPRNGEITQFHCDLAARLQKDVEDAVVYLASSLRRITGAETLAMAGGVALNCVANARVMRDAGFGRVYLPPSAGDSGQALGAALLIGHGKGHPATTLTGYGGRPYSEAEVECSLRAAAGRLVFERPACLEEHVAASLAEGRIVAWFQGGSECGPRALGARSILADPRRPALIERLNRVVKKRFPFQPIAQSVLAAECTRWFNIVESPYMTFATQAGELAHSRTPATVHVDGTSRVHTVSPSMNPLYHRLITAFRRLSDVPMVANTSFNGKGQPIVETPDDAVKCFLDLGIDLLAIGPFVARHC